MNIGLLGFGSMGKTHSYAINNLKYFYDALPFNANVTAVCTKKVDNARRAAATYGFGFAKTEDELISSPDIDVIDICTPNVYHYETLLKAIKAGKHIYCEKPLCVTADQAFEVSALAREKNIVAAVVFNTRFLLPVMRAKELIEEGRLGKIISFRGAFHHSSASNPEKPAGWKQNRDICGGGVLFDLGSHIIDLIYYLCGDFDTVSGMSHIAFPERRGADGKIWNTNADEAFYMYAKLKNGAAGTIEAGKIQLGTNDDLSFEIYGTRGSVKFSLMEPNWLYFYDNGASEMTKGVTRIECVGRYPYPAGVFPGVKAPVGWLRGHIGSMYNFLTAVHENREVSPSFSDAYKIQEIMETAYKSDITGKREKVIYKQ